MELDEAREENVLHRNLWESGASKLNTSHGDWGEPLSLIFLSRVGKTPRDK